MLSANSKTTEYIYTSIDRRATHILDHREWASWEFIRPKTWEVTFGHPQSEAKFPLQLFSFTRVSLPTNKWWWRWLTRTQDLRPSWPPWYAVHSVYEVCQADLLKKKHNIPYENSYQQPMLHQLRQSAISTPERVNVNESARCRRPFACVSITWPRDLELWPFCLMGTCATGSPRSRRHQVAAASHILSSRSQS